jgi:large repetitive protein
MRLQHLLKLTIFVFIATVSYSQSADLSLKLISSGGTQAIYSSIYYRVTVKNAGPNATNNVVARFQLPALTAYTSSNASKGSWDSFSTGNWNIGTLNSGDSAVLNVVLFSLSSSNVVAYSQIIASSASDPDSSPNNNPGNTPVEDDESAFTVTPGAAQQPFGNSNGNTNIDLELTSTTSNPETNFGLNAPIVFKIVNKGNQIASNVKVKINFPAGLEFQNFTASGATFDSVNKIWTMSSIPIFGEFSLIINAKVIGGGNLKTYAQVTNQDQTDLDSAPNNYGSNAVEDDETDIYILGLLVDLELNAALVPGTPSVINVNDNVTYRVVLFNRGPTRSTNTKVRAFIPAGCQYVSSSSTIGMYDTGVNVWVLSTTPDPVTGNKPGFTVPLNATYTLDLTVKVLTAGLISFSPEVRVCNEPDFDSTPSNNSTTEDDDDLVTFTTGVGTTPKVDLELTALTIKNPVSNGDSVVYSMTVVNKGTANATGVTLVFNNPVGITFNTPNLSVGTYSGNTWNIGNLNINGTQTITFRGITAGLTTTVKSFAQVQTASPADSDSSPGNNTSNNPAEDDEAALNFGPTTNNSLVDLELTALAIKNPVSNGDSVVYSMTVVNKGTANATGVTLVFNNPAGITFNTPNLSVGTYSGNTWNIGNLNINGTQTITFRGITAGLTTTVKSFAQVQTASPADTDSSPGNNTSNNPAEDDEAALNFGPTANNSQADLELSMISNSTTVIVGNTVTYTLTLLNKGPAIATNIVVNDVLQSGLTLVSASPTLGTYVSSNWNIPSLAVNGTAVLTITTTVTAITTTLVHFAQVQSVTQQDPDSNPGNNTGTVPSQDDEAAVIVTKLATGNTVDLELSFTSDKNTLPIYTNILFTVTVTNKGISNATGVTVKYVLPTTMAYTSATTAKGTYDAWNGLWNIGNLNVNETVKLEVSLFVLNTNPVIQFAQVQTASPLDIDSTPGNDTNNTPNEDDEALLTLPNTGGPQPKKVDLELSMSSNKTNYLSGAAVAYTLNIKNVGDTIASGITVKDLLPAGLTFVSATGGTYTANTGVWNIGSLAINGTSSLTINTTATGTSTITNFAQVISGTPTDIDSQVNNNSTSTPVEDDEAAATIVPQGTTLQVDLELAMTATPMIYKIYTNVDFKLTLVNNGGTAATGVSVSFPFPAHFVYSGETKSAGTTYDLYTYTWNIGTLAPGQTVTLTLSLFNLDNSGPIKAFAQVKTASPVDIDSSPGNNTTTTPTEDDEATVTITPFVSGVRIGKFDQTAAIDIESVYPNPVDDYLHLGISSKEVQDVEITVYDILGLSVMNEKRNLKLGDNDVVLETYTLPQGTYIIYTNLKHRQSNPVKFIKL